MVGLNTGEVICCTDGWLLAFLEISEIVRINNYKKLNLLKFAFTTQLNLSQIKMELFNVGLSKYISNICCYF